jgi:hypothetical protein
MSQYQEAQCEHATAHGHDKSCPYAEFWKFLSGQIPSLGLRPQARFGGQPPEGRLLGRRWKVAPKATDEGTGSPCKSRDFQITISPHPCRNRKIMLYWSKT